MRSAAYTLPMASERVRELRPALPLHTYEMVFPGDLNSGGIMFGGKVIALMDVCAGMCVARWAHRPAVTASIDAIQFRAPIRQGQMIEVGARIVYVGVTSCIVHCTVTAHNHITGSACFTCEGYFTMVCTDENGRPTLLPMIPVESAEAQRGWDHAHRIKQQLLARREAEKENRGEAGQ
jgi:acyl-CoA hydrolase